MEAKKKFRDTKFGKILINAIPSAGELIGNLLPDKGVLGIAKKLITGSKISPEEKQGTALGTLSTAIYSGESVGPIVVGHLADTVG